MQYSGQVGELLCRCRRTSRIGVGRLAFWVLLGMVEGAHAAAPAVTYDKHIAPILFKYCAPCHRPGESGPAPLSFWSET